jgi:histidinol-phosphate aminotransferase
MGDAGIFLTIKLPGLAKPIVQMIEKEGISAKDLDEYGLSDRIRVSAGLPSQNVKFFEALDNILNSSN